MYIKNNNITKQVSTTFLILISISLLSGCVSQSFENNEPIIKSQANRDEMAATRISLGLGYLKMGDMPQAKMNLEKAKNFSPNLVQVHTAFAHYYETVGESKLAVESFEQALLIKDDSADTLNNYGVFLCRQGDVEAAEVQFLKAIKVPSYLLVSESYENLASCYLQNDDFEKAEMYLRKSIFHSPNRTSTLLQMVRLQYATEDYKEGKRFLQKFERNTQRFTADSLSLAYKLYWKLGQRRTATNYANMLVKMYPQSWEGKQYLLNELEFIAADDLARRYQLSEKQKNRTLTASSTKRVIKLSPNSSRKTIKTTEAVAVTPVAAASVSTTIPVSTPITAQAASSTSAETGVISGTAQATVGAGSAIIANTASTTSMAATTVVAGTTAAVVATVATSAPTEDLASGETEKVSANQVVMDQFEVSEVKLTQTPTKAPLAIEPTDTQLVSVAVVSGADIVETQAPSVVNNDDIVATETIVDSRASLVTDDAIGETEPTSTQPIAALRDAPLPEPIIEPIFEETIEPSVAPIEAETVTAPTAENTQTMFKSKFEPEIGTSELDRELMDDAEKVDIKDAMHIVEPGQNLYNISVKYNVRLTALREWNNIPENNNIRIGDKLYVVDPQTVKMN